jgi:hypothetical protein
LISNWQHEIMRGCEQAGMTLSIPDRATEARVEDFLALDMASTSHVATTNAVDTHPWIESAYGEALRGCANETLDANRLDAIRAALETAEAALGPSVAAMEHQLQVE